MDSKKVGIFSDTHGNLPALEAIVQLFNREKCDEIYHLGDMISMGPYSRECVEYFFAHPYIQCVRGNHDNDFVRNNRVQADKSHISTAHKNFVFDSLGEELRKKTEAVPFTLRREYFGLKVIFTHYAREADDSAFQPLDKNPTPEKLDKMFAHYDADVIFFGHDHTPMSMRGKKLYVDVGSVGCHAGSFARGIILEVFGDGSFKYDSVTEPYDRQGMFEAMKKKALPDYEFIQSFYFRRQNSEPMKKD